MFLRLPSALMGLIISASPAIAAPVYLTCDFTLDGKPFPQSVTVDEQNARVSIMSNLTGSHEVFQAAFSANAVAFSNKDFAYLINRTTLEAARLIPVMNELNKAKCKVDPVPSGRVF